MVVLAEEGDYGRTVEFIKGGIGKAERFEEDKHAVENGIKEVFYKKCGRRFYHLFFVKV